MMDIMWENYSVILKRLLTVNHKILLSKLEFYGIADSMHKLIASYLEGRFQRIRSQSKYYKLNTYRDWVKSHMECSKVPSWDLCPF
jgi:hypothetical protein